MKVKVKFDTAALKKWVFAHGEKVAFGAMALVFLLFTYSALRHEVLSEKNQPDRLKKLSADVNAHVSNSAWDQKREGVLLVDYDKRANRELISVKEYPLAKPLDEPLADQKIKRGSPTVFPVEELRVAAGSGSFALPRSRERRSPGCCRRGTATRRRNQTFAGGQAQGAVLGRGDRPGSVCKTGRRVFASVRACDESQQRPEPASIRRGGNRTCRDRRRESRQTRMEEAAAGHAEVFEKEWEIIAPDVVESEFIDPALTFHLGPLVGTDWDASVSHPKIPLAQAGTNLPQQPVAAQAQKVQEPAAVAGPANAQGRFAKAAQAPAAAAPKSAPDASHVVAAPKPASIGYRLLRVFDYSVEPNHKYRYRITVGLKNPNYQLGPQYLEKPDVAKEESLEIGPTGPTEIVRIPAGHRVLAGALRKKSSASEPSAMLMVITVDQNSGIEATTELMVQRGSLANVSSRPRMQTIHATAKSASCRTLISRAGSSCWTSAAAVRSARRFLRSKCCCWTATAIWWSAMNWTTSRRISTPNRQSRPIRLRPIDLKPFHSGPPTRKANVLRPAASSVPTHRGQQLASMVLRSTRPGVARRLWNIARQLGCVEN